MKLRQYQVDAFATAVFQGNPAAVVPLEYWLEDGLMQAIAGENNLSETAFLVETAQGFDLRWFTPCCEVDLCGHATLAAAYVVFEKLAYREPVVRFATRSGELRVERHGDTLSMDFPAIQGVPCEAPSYLLEGLGIKSDTVLAGDDYLVVLDTESRVRAITPNHEALRRLDLRGVIVTAPGDEVDFVSRFFAPRFGIPEDPVTGSAHCMLTPYWSAVLGRQTLKARQVSKRGGDMECSLQEGRVILRGKAILFMEADLFV